MNFKELLILLQLHRCSYHYLLEIFRYIVNNQLSEQYFDGDLLREVIHRVNLSLDNRRIQQLPLNQINLSRLNEAKNLTNRAIMIGESIYPSNWLQLPQPPLIIYFEGDLALLKKQSISIIGTRNVSHYGIDVIKKLVALMCEEDWVLISGLAKGVDTTVHLEACRLKRKATIGILANGFNYSYPLQNASLQAQMGHEQLLLSEYLPNQKAQRHQFIMRNRLVAGISPVTIVIEAAKDSGSLITANYALQYNREVFVLPGRITDDQAYGCNALLKVGANPILSIESCVAEIKDLLRQMNNS